MSPITHLLTTTFYLTLAGGVLSAAGAVIAFRQIGGGSFRDFLRYALPRDLIERRSCYQDVGFIILKRLLRPLTFTPFLVTSVQGALWTYGAFTWWWGPRSQEMAGGALLAGLLVAAVLIQDFLRFGSHYLLHRLAVLWDVHKVHHSADFLTPLTNHRVHIVEEVIQQASTGFSVGPMLGIAAYLTSTAIATTKLLGFDAYMLLDTLAFGILRHSHIGLSFGCLEAFVMSPKQHHLHHSADPRHWNKNFGFLLSCWDQMAGTLHYSNPRERLSFGITAEEFRDYDTVLKLQFIPFLKIFRRVFHRPSMPEDASASLPGSTSQVDSGPVSPDPLPGTTAAFPSVNLAPVLSTALSPTTHIQSLRAANASFDLPQNTGPRQNAFERNSVPE